MEMFTSLEEGKLRVLMGTRREKTFLLLQGRRKELMVGIFCKQAYC
jgi:hypothetical protein